VVGNRATWLDANVEREARIPRYLDFDVMRTDLEIQVLEYPVVVVDHTSVVAVDEDLGIRRRINDANSAVGTALRKRVIPVSNRRVAVHRIRRIPISEVGPAEIKVEAPARTVAVRSITVRHHIGPVDIRPGDVWTVDVRPVCVCPTGSTCWRRASANLCACNCLVLVAAVAVPATISFSKSRDSCHENGGHHQPVESEMEGNHGI
jgi:hypothetical protein